jgi:hypothetical protein
VQDERLGRGEACLWAGGLGRWRGAGPWDPSICGVSIGAELRRWKDECDVQPRETVLAGPPVLRAGVGVNEISISFISIGGALSLGSGARGRVMGRESALVERG